MKQLEFGFKITINWNKYHPKFKTFPQNKYLNYLIDPGLQGVNRPFVEIKGYNVITDGRNFLLTNIIDFKTYDNIRKTTTGQGDDDTTGCLLSFNYFKEHYKLIAIDLRKQQKLDANQNQ